MVFSDKQQLYWLWYHFHLQGEKVTWNQLKIFYIFRWCVSLDSHQCLYVVLCKTIKQLLTGTGKTLILNSGLFLTNPVFIPMANFFLPCNENKITFLSFIINLWNSAFPSLESWLQNHQCIKFIVVSCSRFHISWSSVSASSFRFLLANHKAWPWPSATFWAACHVGPIWENGPIMSYWW